MALHFPEPANNSHAVTNFFDISGSDQMVVVDGDYQFNGR
jgi:hypothetical protein